MPDDLVTVVDDRHDARPAAAVGKPWKVLIVDDESEVHQATLFALSGLSIGNRRLEFLHAYSGEEARRVLAENGDVAIVLLDVVMETEDAGLQLVHHIRSVLGMNATRIVLRTGQPGYAPEMQVIQDYDINDYKTKAELTRTRLATTIMAAVRSFDQIRTIEAGRRGLDKIVNAAADIFARRGLRAFCDGVLKQMSGLLGLAPEGLVFAQKRTPATRLDTPAPGEELRVVGAAGHYRELVDQPLRALKDSRIVDAIRRTMGERRNIYERGFTTLYLTGQAGNEAAVFLDTGETLGPMEVQLIEVFAANISVGFENVTLFERLHDYAYVDQLVNLPNRNKFVALIDQQAARERSGWVVGIIDIDHFSETNDALGHESGDLLLQVMSLRLREALDPEVLLARVAGDGFGFCGPEAKVDPERILALFQEPFAVEQYMLRISVSIGLARLSDTEGGGLDALKNANLGLKRAKGRTRGRFYFYSPDMAEATRDRVKLAHDLRRSIETHQLSLYYQPQILLSSGRPVGAEGLLRWKNSEGKFIPPDKFIPVAEQSGLILPIGEWVLRTAARQLRNWNAAGIRDFRVAVNVSMAQFRAPGFTKLVQSVVEETGIAAGDLELEITESMAMEEVEIVMATLLDLSRIGVAVAIDDFGTGFSSLGYLQQLKVDRLKIDRRFVDELGSDRGRSTIAEMIVRLGHNLGLQVIAEGVETAEQAAKLAVLGCDQAQGYLYQRPIDTRAFEAWLTSQGVMPPQRK
ncbi:MAG TPA: EAL domain-containing protein [Burkholderiales bacterium]|nr:EAL domain-containing protein [Burkholderiales bacterium]